jgi:type I restriction enzyme S subunit
LNFAWATTWFLQSAPFLDQLKHELPETTIQNISMGQLRNCRLPVPLPAEQSAITDFLDRETAKIDALVAEQENLIALLKEKRQAVISHAVTKGLDPTVPMKDSGVEWLGEVPAHWIVQPLKFSALFRSGGTPDKGRLDYWNGQIPWASAKDLKVENLYDTADHITDQTIIDGVISLLPTETVVVVVRGMILARLLPVVTIKVPMAINQDLKALIPKEHVSSTFLPWLLRASEVESLTRLDEAGHGTKALRMDAWGAMKVSLPPKQEQKAIAAFLDLETTKLDDLTTEAQRTIDLLKERRSALISAAVTGKIDVRGYHVHSQPIT